MKKILNLKKIDKDKVDEEVDFSKEVMEKDALNRIIWDSRLSKKENFKICYIHDNKLKEVNFTEIKIEGDFMLIEETYIPMHRIRKIKYKDKVVWDKRRNLK